MKRILSTLLILAMLMPMSVFAANDHLQFTIPAEYFYGNVIPDYVFKVNAPRIDKGEPIHLYMAGEVDVYYCTGPVEIQFNDETPAAIEQIGGGVSYAKDFSFAPSLMPEEHIPADDGVRHYMLVKEGVYYASCRVMNAGASAFFVIEDCQEYKPELKSFSDVATGRWSHNAIMEMVKLGMFNGTKDPDMYGIGEFSPEGTMSKAQFITVMTRYLYADELSAMGSGKTWFSNAYELAVKKGLISESEFDYAKLEKPMTREEMALIAVRTAEKQGEKAGTLVDTSMLKDYSSIGSYYKDYALKAFSMGLITGYGDVGTFAPDKTLTREQGAMVAYRLVNKDSRADVSLLLPMTIHYGEPTPRLAREGDIFIKQDGTKVVLKKGPNGILGEGQCVAPDQFLKTKSSDWDRYTFTYDEAIDGKLTNSIGWNINDDTYRLNATTGEGHWLSEWRILENIYPEPEYNGTKHGEISKDKHNMYVWYQNRETGWFINLAMNQAIVID